MFTTEQINRLKAQAERAGITPANCPNCEYDRRFPGFEGGGWLETDNNGPIVACPLCNPDGAHPRP